MVECNPNYEDAEWALYRYVPSTSAPAVFAALYGLTMLLHIFQMVRTRTWYLTALIVGACCECLGYIGRTISAQEDEGCWSLGPYIMQNVLILISPAFMAASIYMILGRIILLTEGEHHALIKRRWLTKLFVTGDVISLLLQASGGGLMGSDEDLMDTGENMVIIGLFVQLVFFGSFVVVSGLFHMRMRRNPTPKANSPLVRWQFYLITLYVTSTLILIRSVFRVIEYIQGNDAYLMTTEAFVFIFDGVLMFIVLAWMNWFHPSEIGLLLRGEPSIKNGFELVTNKRSHKHDSALESLSSEQGRARTRAAQADSGFDNMVGDSAKGRFQKRSVV